MSVYEFHARFIVDAATFSAANHDLLIENAGF